MISQFAAQWQLPNLCMTEVQIHKIETMLHLKQIEAIFQIAGCVECLVCPSRQRAEFLFVPGQA